MDKLDWKTKFLVKRALNKLRKEIKLDENKGRLETLILELQDIYEFENDNIEADVKASSITELKDFISNTIIPDLEDWLSK